MSLTISTEGLRRAEERVQRVAERLARLPLQGSGSPEDIVELSDEMVALIEARHAHAANAKAIETHVEMQRHLLDILS
jgi:flagellar hook-associated protein FlgK